MARILITGGPTREPIDAVRFVSNRSSGRTAAAIASEALRRGHDVDLVLGPADVEPPAGARVARVETCAEMLEACRRLHPACDAVIGAAAVSDFRPATPLAGKRRREDGAWSVELVPNPDILAELAAGKGARIHIGFALQWERGEEAVRKAREKLAKKGLDWVVLNGPETLGREGGTYVLLGRTAAPRDLGRLPKEALAGALIDLIENSLKRPALRPDNE